MAAQRACQLRMAAGFAFVVTIVFSGCSFEAGFGGAECSNEGAQRSGYVCQDGLWVERATRSDGSVARGRGGDAGTRRGGACDRSETCDGRDNDCDGDIDEGCNCDPGSKRTCYSGPAGSADLGVCTSGTMRCSSAGVWGDCAGEVVPDSEDRCGDDLDNDCDGTADEGCPCNYRQEAVGLCAKAKIGEDGSCQRPAGVSQKTDDEECDGADNDCDGAVDEGCRCAYEGKERGVCAEQRRNAEGTCPKPSNWEPPSSAESQCDGLDNDCDGTVDDGCDCENGASRDCYTGPSGTEGVGACKPGTQHCRGGTWGECSGAETPRNEICSNGEDDDCDGSSDAQDADCRKRAPGASCSGDGECAAGACVDGTCAHRIFVTAARFAGDLNGLTGADSKCESAATSAGLEGTWRAVLSTSSESPKGRLDVRAPVVNVRREQLAAGRGSLWSGNLSAAVAFDASGNAVQSNVWTGSNRNGSAGGPNCKDWSLTAPGQQGAVGDSDNAGGHWLDRNQTVSCNARASLYCIDGQ